MMIFVFVFFFTPVVNSKFLISVALWALPPEYLSGQSAVAAHSSECCLRVLLTWCPPSSECCFGAQLSQWHEAQPRGEDGGGRSGRAGRAHIARDHSAAGPGSTARRTTAPQDHQLHEHMDSRKRVDSHEGQSFSTFRACRARFTTKPKCTARSEKAEGRCMSAQALREK